MILQKTFRHTLYKLNPESNFTKLLYPNIYYMQKRNICFPLIMGGGMIQMFVLTQMWNPYFPRTALLELQRAGFILTFFGVII